MRISRKSLENFQTFSYSLLKRFSRANRNKLWEFKRRKKEKKIGNFRSSCPNVVKYLFLSVFFQISYSFNMTFIVSGALPFVTASVFCWSGIIKWLTIISYSCLCLWGLHKALSAGSPWQRRLCFALPFLMRVILQVLRMTRFGGGNPNAMIHVFLQVSKRLNVESKTSLGSLSPTRNKITVKLQQIHWEENFLTFRNFEILRSIEMSTRTNKYFWCL